MNLRAQNVPLAVLADALADTRLSYKAKGLFAALCQRRTTGRSMRYAELAADSSDGKIAVTSGMRELYEHGYARAETLREGNGGSISGRRIHLEACPGEPPALALLRGIQADLADLPPLDWTVRADGELHGALPEKAPTAPEDRRRAFDAWASALEATRLPERRCKGYLVLRAGTPVTPGHGGRVPVWLHAEIDDGIA